MRLEINAWGKYVAILNEGKNEKRVKLKVSTLEEAKYWVAYLNLERMELLLKSGELNKDLIKRLTGQIPTVKEAIELWYDWAEATYESDNTTTNYHTGLQAWMNDTHVADENIGDITERDLDKWVNKQDGVKVGTRQCRLKALRSLFYYLTIKRHVEVDVSMLVSVKYYDLSHEQKEGRPKRAFTDAEYDKVIAHLRKELEHPWPDKCNTRFWLAAVIIGRNSALRLSDIAQLERASTATGKLVVHTGKMNTRVEQELTPELKAVLDSVEMDDETLFFPFQAELSLDPDKRAQLSLQFSAILKKAGVSGVTFHSLRRTKLQEMDKAGNPHWEIAAFAGHGSPRSLEYYLTRQPTTNHEQATRTH